MTTYTSTNTRPCADCGLRICPERCNSLGLMASLNLPTTRPPIVMAPYVPGLPSGPIDGEIVHPGGGNVTVPIIDLSAHPADYVTMTGVLEALEKGPQSHAAGRVSSGRMPVWPIALVFVGSILAALGLVLTDPVTQLVWSLLHDG